MSEEASLDEFAAASDVGEKPAEQPKSQFWGAIPEDWELVGGSDVYDVNPNPKPDEELNTYIEMGALDTELPWPQYFGERDASEYSGKTFSAGDTLFARITPCTENGKAALVPEMGTNVGIGSTEFAVLSPKRNSVNPWFLYYLGKSHPVHNYAVSRMRGSTGRQRVPFSVFRQELDIALPPLEEQRKIATVLYTIDQAIQKTDKIIKQTGRTQRGIEQRLFQEGYFDHPDVKEQRLVTIPSGWKFEQLSKHTKDSAFGPRFSSDRYGKDGSIATLRTTDLNDRGHITYETMPVANLEQSEIEDHLLEPADFMITRSGTTGIGTVWGEYDKPTVPGAFLIRFRFEESISSQFMKYYVNSSIGRKRINRRAKGGVQKNLAGSDLLNMRFPIPSMDEQEKIVEVLDTTERRIKSEHKFKSRLQRFKQGLMQDLLSGAVRTHDTDIDILEAVLAHG